nr:hypothetical protein [Tanacetum cinerariifolium]
FTRSRRIPVSAAEPKAATSTSAAKLVNTAKSFYNATAHSKINSTKRVNTAGSKVVSAVKGNKVTAVKAQQVVFRDQE